MFRSCKLQNDRKIRTLQLANIKIGEEIKSFEIDTFCHCSTVRWTHKMTEYGGDHHANKTERFQINFAVTKRL